MPPRGLERGAPPAWATFRSVRSRGVTRLVCNSRINNGESPGRLAGFLNDVGMAWAEADQTQRNRLACQLLDAV